MKKLLICSLLLIGLGVISKVQALCPYVIASGGGCTVTIDVSYVDGSGNPATTTVTIPATGGNVNLSTYLPGLSGGYTSLTSIDVYYVSTAKVTINCSTPPFPNTALAGCQAGSNISWDNTQVTVRP